VFVHVYNNKKEKKFKIIMELEKGIYIYRYT